MDDITHSTSTVVIDIEKIQRILQANSKNYNWESLHTSRVQNPPCIISKVPQQTRNAHLYDPIAISIGPYHHGEPSLQITEKKKWQCLDFILAANTKRTLKDYLKGLQELYPLAKSFYANEVKIESNKFVQLLLLDGCFILMALCHADSWEGFLIHDLFLLVENQIPFAILKRVHKLIAGEENIGIPSIAEDITNFVEQVLYNYPKAITTSDRPQHFQHILHLCHMYLRPSQNNDHISVQQNIDDQPLHSWHRAVEYYQVGLEFAKREFDENNPHSLLDMSLSYNVMEIPCLPIEGYFITIFRNLIAFEHMNPQFGNDITAYAFFMSKLISNVDDVSLLVSKGIIEHHFQSDEEVADIFVKLGAGIGFDIVSNFYLKSICQGLGEFYQSRTWWKKWLSGTSTTIRSWILKS